MVALILLILTLTFILDIWLAFLNYRNKDKPIPEEVEDVYDEKTYKIWLEYTMENFRLSLISKTVRLVIFIFLLLFNFFPFINDIAIKLSSSRYIQILLFLAIYQFLEFVVDIPISNYKQFSIEARYGFNKSTYKTFVLDQIKSIILTAILGGGFVLLLSALFYQVGNLFYIYAWATVILIGLFINLFYVKLFIPLFNKLTPLKEGELKEKIIDFSSRIGYEVTKISIMDASKRSTKLNAFFTGFGKFKKVILFDTLLDKMNNDQIISILAHEIGHSKKNHITKNLFVILINISIYLLVLLFAVKSDDLSIAFGFSKAHFGFGLILFTILISPISLIIGFLMNILSRKFEYEADRFAASNGYKKELEESLKILAKENFANLTPHPLYVSIKYSHPPIAFRIMAIRKIKD